MLVGTPFQTNALRAASADSFTDAIWIIMMMHACRYGEGCNWSEEGGCRSVNQYDKGGIMNDGPRCEDKPATSTTTVAKAKDSGAESSEDSSSDREQPPGGGANAGETDGTATTADPTADEDAEEDARAAAAAAAAAELVAV